MTDPQSARGWVIVSPTGLMYMHTVRGTEASAWEPFELLCSKDSWERDGYRALEVAIIPAAGAEKESLPCGHPTSLLVKSVESAAQFCELCDLRSQRDDAVTVEQELQGIIADLPDTIRNSTWKTPELRESAATLVRIICRELRADRPSPPQREQGQDAAQDVRLGQGASAQSPCDDSRAASAHGGPVAAPAPAAELAEELDTLWNRKLDTVEIRWQLAERIIAALRARPEER